MRLMKREGGISSTQGTDILESFSFFFLTFFLLLLFFFF